jgi:hypothetical protein
MVYVFCACVSAMLPQFACAARDGQITVVSMLRWRANYARMIPAKVNVIGDISTTEQCGPSLRGERGFFKSGVRLLAKSS